MKRIAKTLLVAGVLMGITQSAFAASDGSIGTTSTGTADVSMTIPELVIITGTADIALGSYSGTGTMTGNDNLIVSGNDDQATPTYSVTVSSADCSTTQFRLQRATLSPTEYVNMTVSWNDATGTVGAAALDCGAALTAQGAINATLADVTPNANISVSLSQANLRAAPRGVYGTTLSILITPT